MTLDKAIKIKFRTGDEFLLTDPDEIEEAERLSIEALKRVKWHKDQHEKGYYELLPGETED